MSPRSIPRLVRKTVPVAFLVLLPAFPAETQEPPRIEVPADTSVIQVLELQDGSRLYGRVIDVGPPVRFRLRDGQTVTLDPVSIREVRVSRGRVVDGEIWDPDPNPTRLFFAPTARTTPAGSGYFSVFELFIPFLTFSVTDRFMIGAGTPLIGDFDGGRPFWIAPKFQVVRRDRTQVAVGIWSISTGDAEDGIFSLLFGTGTFGSTDQAVTVGVGYGMVDTELADRPALVLGGETRVSRRVKLVTENWILPESVGFASVGPRFMGDRLSADLGLALAFADGDHFVFPLVNFVFSW